MYLAINLAVHIDSIVGLDYVRPMRLKVRVSITRSQIFCKGAENGGASHVSVSLSTLILLMSPRIVLQWSQRAPRMDFERAIYLSDEKGVVTARLNGRPNTSSPLVINTTSRQSSYCSSPNEASPPRLLAANKRKCCRPITNFLQ